MIIGYMLAVLGALQLAAGLYADVELATVVGAFWLAAGALNVVSSRRHRQSSERVRTEDMVDPLGRARLYQGVRGQLGRGLVALACACVAVAGPLLGLSEPRTLAVDALMAGSGGLVGLLSILGLLVYALTSTEREAVIPAIVEIVAYRQLPISGAKGQPYVRLELDVQPDGGARYAAVVQTMVPALAIPKLAIGARFPARVAGPAKPDSVFIGFAGATSAPAAAGNSSAGSGRGSAAPVPGEPALPLADRLRRLDALLADGLISQSEHREQRTRLLDAL